MTQSPVPQVPTQLVVAKPINMNLPVRTVNTFSQFVNQPKIRLMLEKAATKHLTIDRLLSMVSVAISRTPKLALCTPLSLLNGCLDAALNGCVTIGGPNARGYLVPYKNGRLTREAQEAGLIARDEGVFEAQYQDSYLGMCDKARRSEEVAFVDGFAVYEGDTFDYDQGFNSKLVHKSSPDPKAIRTKATLRYVYAIARYRTHDLPQFRVLGMAEVEEHRARSRAKDDGPWVTDYIPMAIKTAVRVLCKWLPQTPEMLEQEAKEVERDFVFGPTTLMLPSDAAGAPGDRAQALADRLGAGPGTTGEVIDEVTGEVTPAPEPVVQDAATAAKVAEAKAKLAEKKRKVEHDPNTGEVVPSAAEVAQAEEAP